MTAMARSTLSTVRAAAVDITRGLRPGGGMVAPENQETTEEREARLALECADRQMYNTLGLYVGPNDNPKEAIARIREFAADRGRSACIEERQIGRSLTLVAISL